MRRSNETAPADLYAMTTSDMSRRSVLRGAAVLAALPASGLLSACGGGAAQSSGSGGTQQWRFGVPELKSDSVFQTLGVTKGFYEEAGINCELVQLESGTTTVRGVLAGDLQMGACGPSGVFAAQETGAPLLITGSVLARVPHVIYVHESINSLADLAGKEIGTGEPGALLQQCAYATLQRNGVDPDSATYVNVGGSPDIFAAVVGGTVPAGVAGSEYREELEADPSIPVKVLTPILDHLPNYLRNIDIVSEALLNEDRDLVVRAVTAQIKGAQYALENREEAIEWAMKETDATKAGATAVWEEFKAKHLVNLKYTLTREQMDETQQICIDTGVISEPLPFDDIVDFSIAQDAKAKL